jgi:hypothetical protein
MGKSCVHRVGPVHCGDLARCECLTRVRHCLALSCTRLSRCPCLVHIACCPRCACYVHAVLQLRGDKLISYEEAREYFSKDPALSWAAYVAGALVVLAHEFDIRYTDGLSILVVSGMEGG